jgi:hypothetical protein
MNDTPTSCASDLMPLRCPFCKPSSVFWMQVGISTLITCEHCGGTERALIWWVDPVEMARMRKDR